jgi:hypothetical protein
MSYSPTIKKQYLIKLIKYSPTIKKQYLIKNAPGSNLRL